MYSSFAIWGAAVVVSIVVIGGGASDTVVVVEGIVGVVVVLIWCGDGGVGDGDGGGGGHVVYDLNYRVGFGPSAHFLRPSVMKLYIHVMIHCLPLPALNPSNTPTRLQMPCPSILTSLNPSATPLTPFSTTFLYLQPSFLPLYILYQFFVILPLPGIRQTIHPLHQPFSIPIKHSAAPLHTPTSLQLR